MEVHFDEIVEWFNHVEALNIRIMVIAFEEARQIAFLTHLLEFSLKAKEKS